MFKTFNQTSAEDMAGALDFAERPVMFDPAKKPIVLGFFDELGFKAIDNSRLLEPYGMLWIDQAPMRGARRDFAFVRLRRK